MEPQAGLLSHNTTDKAKYMKEIIWIDDGQSVADEDVSVNPSVASLRESLSNTLMNALAKNELVDGVREPSAMTVQQYAGSSESYPTSTSAITLSRDIIPILLQRSARYGRGSPRRVEGMSGPTTTASPLFLEDLVREKQREQSELKPEPMSYASASSTQSYQDSRPSFAFDGNPNTLWVSRPWNNNSNNNKPQWIEYSFDEPQTIGEYSLASYPSLEMNMARSKSTLSLSSLGEAVFGGPTGWTLTCSKDGVDWVDLHDVRLSQPWVPGERRSFSVREQSWWNYCRVYVHAVPKRSDGSMQVALSEVTFSAPSTSSSTHESIPSEFGHPPQQQRNDDDGIYYHHTSGGYGTMRGIRDYEEEEAEIIPSEFQGWWKDSDSYGITQRNFFVDEESGRGIVTTPRSALPLVTEEYRAVAHQHQATQGDGCVFPFMHNNILQYNCIPFQEAHWCKSRENDWLVCHDNKNNAKSLLQEEEERQSQSMPARSQSSYLESSNERSLSLPLPAKKEYTVARRQCKFPFLHFGSLHNECVMFQDEFWCKDHQDRWLHCREGDNQYGSSGEELGEELSAADSGNKDWFISLANSENTMEEIQSLNVIEMKPKTTSSSSENDDGDGIEYEVCKTSGSSDFELYIPPRYTRLPLGDDEAANVKLPDGFAFPFYGKNYDNIYVGSNGYITLGLADTNYLPTEESHLQKKRISVFFSDVDTSEGGEVQFADLNTAVAITWKNVTIQDPNSHENIPQQTFQTILFEDGTIWMGFQQVRTNSSIIGLSSGAQGLAQVEAVTSLGSLQDC
jgi:hypothetical protein